MQGRFTNRPCFLVGAPLVGARGRGAGHIAGGHQGRPYGNDDGRRMAPAKKGRVNVWSDHLDSA